MKKTKYITSETQIITSRHLHNVMFYNDNFSINDDMIIVRRHYAWEGCLFRFRWLDLYWSLLPDGVDDKTTRASMIHSALYRFRKEVYQCGVTRKMADRIFYDLMLQENFKLAKLYFIIARSLGWIYGSWK